MVSRRGGEKVVEALAELLRGATLFTLVHDARRCPAPPFVSRVQTTWLQHVPLLRRRFRALLPVLPSLYRGLDLSGHELVVTTDAALAKSVRVPRGAWHVCYCFSPPRYAWDLQDTYLQRGVRPPLRPATRAVMARVRRLDWRAAQSVDRFIAVSAAVAERIRRCYRRDADVVPPPVDTTFFAPGDGEALPDPADRPYLALGAVVPYKRFEDAVDACRRSDRTLVVAGDGPGFDALRRRAGSRTTFVRAPDDERVRELYRSCRALLFPGEEDFGLVPVEAMACGRPVVAWNRGGAAETVVPGSTGVLYDREGTDGLLEGLDAFESVEASLLDEDCVARATRYDRARFLERMRPLLMSR
jgi:glycosyltransferase involved in cell wall biosynthesis